MRVLITGCNGFIGSHLSLTLKLQENITVFGIDLQPQSSNCHYYTRQDILDYKGLEWAFDTIRPHIVLHLAAKLGVQDVMDKPGETVSENVLGTLHITNLARHFNTHVIFASTSDVYGHSTDLPFKETSHCSIGPSVEPRWSYAISKLAGEHLTLSVGGTVIRFFNVTGPGQPPKYVVPIMVQKALRGDSLPVLGDGSATRCYADVRDVVKALVALVDVPFEQMAGEIYNLGTDKEISTLELAEEVRYRVNRNVGIEFLPYPANYTEMPRRVPDTSKIRELLEWKPRIGLGKTLRDMADKMGAKI